MTKMKKKGFSLLELIIAIFIFTLIMTTAVGVFSNIIKGYRKAKVTQRDLEDAQTAMNVLAKSLRTSVAVSCDGADCTQAPHQRVRIYDFSQTKCIEYSVDTAMRKATQKSTLYVFPPPADPQPSDSDLEMWCKGIASFSDTNDLVTDVNKGSLYVVPSTATQAGRMTMSLEICPNATCNLVGATDAAIIQTTVSLRASNFKEIGL